MVTHNEKVQRANGDQKGNQALLARAVDVCVVRTAGTRHEQHVFTRRASI
jgi:hypothetical protein